MSQVIYRKYRPQTFKDLIGQNAIRITLENEIEQGRVSHAYLFSGPRGVGKTTTARLLAKAVNCTNRKGAEPCNACDFCKDFTAGNSMDLIEIDAASHTGVDNVRENIIENSRFTPQRAKFKVFIIDEVHMLSVSSFNALLKTLEEPPEYVIFILATTEIHRVPETIISRCQRFDFKRVSPDDLVKRLKTVTEKEKINIEESILRNIAQRSEGSVRDAEVMLNQLMSLGEKEITEEKASLVIPRSDNTLVLEFFQNLVQNDIPANLALINKLIDEGVDIQEFTRDLIEFFRYVLLMKITSNTLTATRLDLNTDNINEIKKSMNSITVDWLISVIEKFVEKSREFKYTTIIQLPLELAIVELDRSKKTEIEGSQDANKPKDGGGTKPPADGSALPKAKHDKPPVPRKMSAKSTMNMEILKSVWLEILQALRGKNYSLALSLKVGLPKSVDNQAICIAFQYKFHAEQVAEPEAKNILGGVIENITRHALKIKTEVVSESAFQKLEHEFLKGSSQEAGESEAWNQALNVFGGEIVEEEA
ncbi:MAG: DNA polymerase III subunit gamma/tau [Patescibacteria group bacterium]|jgi:DNA polymerase-3 subunit gamma/tau